MPRAKRVRSGDVPGVLRRHAIMSIDPAAAAQLASAFTGHILPKTSSTYQTSSDMYVEFCEVRKVPPWPVDAIWFCAWIQKKARSIRHTSLKMYMAGVRHASELEGFPWQLDGDARVRSVLRWVRRRYPAPEKRNKIAISTSVLRIVLPQLRGWPNARQMAFDDLLFATASVIATSAFLRGGEFLFSKDSDRPLLRQSHLQTRAVAASTAVVVHVVQPKTAWWLDEVLVPCFENSADSDFCPVRLWRAYRSRLGAKAVAAAPAFMHFSGAPLSKAWMLKRTSSALAAAHIRCVDGDGEDVMLAASSWRAGGVRSAIDAGVPESRIMALGRWKSSAWMHYLIHTGIDFQSAAAGMWAVQAPLSLRSGCLRVGECDTGACFVSELKEQESVVASVNAEVAAKVAASSSPPTAVPVVASRLSRARKRPSRFL